jgi:hypothetical protein
MNCVCDAHSFPRRLKFPFQVLGPAGSEKSCVEETTQLEVYLEYQFARGMS